MRAMVARVLDLELSTPLSGPIDLDGYSQALVLLRWEGCPVGVVRLPARAGAVQDADLRLAIQADPLLSARLARTALASWLDPPASPALPSWSVIVCTRDRPADLRRCLDSLLALRASGGEIIIVDNCPSDDDALRQVEQYAKAAVRPVHYQREDRPGLNRARSAGARRASGEVVIFTDDDAVADSGWAGAILAPFTHRRVAAVTGLTLPLELQTDAQELFEAYGGFSRGFERRAFDFANLAPAAAGAVGAGVNMALRRELVNSLRLFDAELDGGTPARTGGDAYAFYQLLAQGYQIVYQPAALVWHRHRRDYASLRRTLAGYSVGGFAFLTRCWLQHGDWQAPAVAASWLWKDHARQLARTLLRRPGRLPFDLVLAQLLAVPLGPWAYFAGRRRERSVSPPAAGGRL